MKESEQEIKGIGELELATLVVMVVQNKKISTIGIQVDRLTFEELNVPELMRCGGSSTLLVGCCQ